MRLPRVRFTVRRGLVAVAVVACGLAALRVVGFRSLEHWHRHRAHDCGCVRRDMGRLSWGGRRSADAHLRMAGLFRRFADWNGEPPGGCGILILDPIPGEAPL